MEWFDWLEREADIERREVRYAKASGNAYGPEDEQHQARLSAELEYEQAENNVWLKPKQSPDMEYNV